jgi:probable addiction module antidote protein
MKVETYPYDSAEFLTDDETIAEYLTLSLESGDAQEIAQALATVVRARGGVPKLAGEIGIDPDSLTDLLKDGEQSALPNMLKLMNALGIRLSASKVA